jgi:aspartyl-tRNA(Asn)/glutamyl-tRNA(Gln) amidotransferase subunit A
VRRLRQAGAILIGKTTTHEFAWGMTGCNRHFGTGRNPWSLGHVTGGSSAGSAAALAAEEVPLALGSDTGGSIRIPAGYCGVAGLKPTYGLVDTTGVFPLGPSLDHAGPMARTPDDLRLALSVLAPSASWATPRDLRGLRVGVCAVVAGVEPTALVRQAVEDAAGVMAALGCETTDVVFEHDDDARRAFAVIQQAEALAVHRRAGLWPSRREEYGDDVRGRLEGAESVTLDDQVAARIEREHLRVRLDRLFGTVDLLLLPVSPSPPVEWGLEDLDHLGERRLIRDIVLPVTSPLNLAGVPACAVRGGFDDLGVPIGLQLVGPHGSDVTVLAAAGAFFGATPDLQQQRPKL